MSDTMRWFGPPWESPINEDCPRCKTPEGQTCIHCDEGFSVEKEDRGIITCNDVPMHIECFIRTLVGSASHQLRMCSCFPGGSLEWHDPPELTKREAARLAWELFTKKTPAEVVADGLLMEMRRSHG
jgi:hypothetical protein